MFNHFVIASRIALSWIKYGRKWINYCGFGVILVYSLITHCLKTTKKLPTGILLKRRLLKVKVRQYYCPMSKNGSIGVKNVLEMGNWGQSPQTLSNFSEFREKLGISKSFGYYYRLFESYLIKKNAKFWKPPERTICSVSWAPFLLNGQD